MNRSRRLQQLLFTLLMMSSMTFLNAQEEVKEPAVSNEAGGGDQTTKAVPDLSGLWILWGPEGAQRMPIKAKATTPNSYVMFSTSDQPLFDVAWSAADQLFEARRRNVEIQSGYYFVPGNTPDSLRALPFADAEQRNRALEMYRSNQFLQQMPQYSIYRAKFDSSIKGFGVLIAETKEGLNGYSESLGVWDHIEIPLPKDGFPRLTGAIVGRGVAMVVIDDQLFGFGEHSGKWSRIRVPLQPNQKIIPTVGSNFAFAQVGEPGSGIETLIGFSSSASHFGVLKIPPESRKSVNPTLSGTSLTATIDHEIYALSPKTGEWTSAKGASAATTETPQNDHTLRQNKVVRLQRAAPDKLRDVLKKMYPDITVVSDPLNSTLLLSATKSEFEQIDSVIRAVDQVAVSDLKNTSRSANEPTNSATEQPSTKPESDVVLAFMADWAGPCQKLQPILRPLIRRGLPIRIINIDQEPELAKSHQITSIPTFVLLHQGRELRRTLGIVSKDQVLGMVAEVRWPEEKTVANAPSASQIVPPAASEGRRRISDREQALRNQLTQLEADAMKLADTIRSQRKMDPDAATEQIAEHQRLQQAVSSALDVKFQIEQLQLQELKQKLQSLERQIDQRKAVRQKIIDRRSRELIEGDATRWEPQSRSVPTRTAAENPPFSPKKTQVRFGSPAGMVIAWETQNGDLQNELIAPARYNFTQGATYRLKLSDIPGRKGLVTQPTLQFYPPQPNTDAYLAHNSVSIDLTQEDLDQIEGNHSFTKVFYLRDAKFQELAATNVEMLVSSRLDPDVDPILEADRRGTIIAVMQVSAESSK